MQSWDAPLPSLQDLNTSRVRKRAKKVPLDPSHPAHCLFELLTSGRYYRAAGLLLAWPTPVLTAERFSTRVLWGSRIAMVQTEALLGPLVRLVSPKVELYENVGDSFSWRLVKIELPRNLCPPIGQQ